MQQMAAYAGTSITTELIQKYLDENKQLILAILDNQNLGKLNECANYQAKLQQNLMYLAAIADAQPQVSQNSAQVPAAQPMQASQQYIQQQQQQQQQQQMMMNQRSSVPQYMQQSQQGSQNTSPPSQQAYHNQQGVGSSGMHMMNNSMGGNGNQAAGSMSEYGKAEGSRDGSATNLNTRNDGPQTGPSTLGHAREGNGVAGEEAEASYLKSSE